MQIKSSIVLLIIAFSVLGCSWTNHFMIVNESDETITIRYTIEPPKKTFGIFSNLPSMYPLKKKQHIDWYAKLTTKDLDTNIAAVHIELPPKTVLIIGELHNDNYEKYDQYFINGRSFNLGELKITHANNETTIVPNTFDDFFKKNNGNISYVLK